MPFDFEARAQREMQSQQRLRVGIVGFGKFGQFLARRLIAAGHQVGSFGAPVKPCTPLAALKTIFDARLSSTGAVHWVFNAVAQILVLLISLVESCSRCSDYLAAASALYLWGQQRQDLYSCLHWTPNK